MTEIIDYILRFLLGEQVSPDIFAQVGYTADSNEFHRYKLIILPSAFFEEAVYGSELSLPNLPLQIWEDAPILFGQPIVEQIGETRILHADLIASTYFLISRYEEMVRRECRDIHGRFPGKESLPYRAGFVDRPVVDEYGKIIRMQLREIGCEAPEPPAKIQKIFLTHDVDQIAHYRNFRGFMGGLLRGLKRPKEGNKALRSYFRGLRYDPWYNFPWLFRMDNSVKLALGSERCESVIFIKVKGGKRKEDKPNSKLLSPDFKTLCRLCRKKDIIFGLHTSYEAGLHPELIFGEKKKLNRIAKSKVKYNRHHYLDAREPEDMQALIDAGITDDFTMGYADMAGFRLGTCRPVKWINPKSSQLSSLILHSLTIMDCTLSEKRYMYLNSFDAYEYCVQLTNSVEKYNGELILLWHNTSVEISVQSYHRKLYKDLIEYLKLK